MNICTITLIDSKDEDKISPEDSKRCIGWFDNTKEALDAVKANKGDMHECLYNYIVIEEVPSGVWKLVTNEVWFTWSMAREEWVPCKKPRKYRTFANVSGFGMG